MIQMTKEELNSYDGENINQLVSIINPILEHRERLYQRYRRKSKDTAIMAGTLENGKVKAIVPFEYYIVHMVQGYLGGKAPMYSVASPSDYAINTGKKGFFERVARTIGANKAADKKRDARKQEYVKSYTEAMEYIRRYNDDAATYVELLHDYLTTSAAYLYLYENEDNEIVYTRFDSRQTVAIYDYATPPNHIGTVRKWDQKKPDGTLVPTVELITADSRRKYLNGKLEGEPEPLAWGDIPCVAFENPDAIAVFEPALSMIDTYEQTMNNVRNMTWYNDNAKLLLRGYAFETEATITGEDGQVIPNPARKVEEEAILCALALSVGENGDISWLVKNVEYSGILDTLKRYHDLITLLTGVPNMTDEAFANADNASALGYKLYALDQYSATTDRVFKKGLLRRDEIITGRLNLKGSHFDFRDETITLQRNIPTDKDKSLDRAIKAYSGGLVSQETALNESQIEVDAKEEMHRQQEEQEQDYSLTLERNQRLGQESEPDQEDGNDDQEEITDGNR